MTHKLAPSPLPNPNFDWNENFKWIAGCVSALISYAYYINLYFKNKAKEKEEFIQNVVKATLRETLDGELKSIKDNIDILFKYREADRKHIDDKFDKLMIELKK